MVSILSSSLASTPRGRARLVLVVGDEGGARAGLGQGGAERTRLARSACGAAVVRALTRRGACPPTTPSPRSCTMHSSQYPQLCLWLAQRAIA